MSFFAFGVIVLAVIVLGAGGNSQALGALFTAPLLLVVTYGIARRIATADNNPQLVPILMGGLCLKLIGSLVRYWVSSGLYGTGDFYDYDKWGRTIAAGLRHGHLVGLNGRLAGTDFMRYVTGYIYTVTPARMMSGFVVYGWLSFIGLLFFWRAYRVAISDRHDVTYLTWLLVLPSMLYWPSAIGKDAFMMLAGGIAAYGVACLFANRTLAGLAAVAVGILGMVMVRPHFALAVCGGLGLAVLLKRNRGGIMRTLVNVAFVVALGAIVVQSASTFFGISTFNRQAIVAELNDASSQTAEGGSHFTPVVVTSPLQFPLAAVTVLYRPLPYEAHSAQEMLTAFEGLALVVLTMRAFRRSMRALRYSRDYPYLLYCIGAIMVFIIAFSGFSNFGILARERTVIQPLFLVFLSLPADIDGLFRPSNRRAPRAQLPANW